MELDLVDRKILGLLKKDARIQFAEIGKRVSLSAPAVHARVKKMEANGVISRYTVDVNPNALGASLTAFIRIQRNKGLSEAIAEAFLKIQEIEECHAVAGEDCLIVKLRVGSAIELAKILDQIRSIEGIDRTVTMVVLESHFERGFAP